MNTKKLALTALLIALSFICSNLKIFGTIAFDSLPAFLGALLLGPWYGAVIGFMGHIFTSLLSGFPFGILIHGVIAVSMAITMIGVAFAHKMLRKMPVVMNLAVISVLGTILNGPVAFFIVYPFLVPLMGKEGSMVLLPILTLASLANVVLASVVFASTQKVLGKNNIL